jgi:hypothetical protein
VTSGGPRLEILSLKSGEGCPAIILSPRPLLAVIKYTYLPPTHPNFIQDIEDKCLLQKSSMSLVDLPFQEHQMMEKHHMD